MGQRDLLAVILCLSCCFCLVSSQGWLWAYGQKKAWFITRALEIFPAEWGGKSPYTNDTISGECLRQLVVYGVALGQGKPWAGEMFDADSQVPPGLAGQNLNWRGAYEQCLGVKSTNTPVQVAPGVWLMHDFDAKYCTAYYEADYTQFSFTNCVPSGCSHVEVQSILKHNTSTEPAFDISYEDCGQDDQTYDVSSIVCTVILVILGALVAIATFYDFFTSRKEQDSSPEQVSPQNVNINIEQNAHQEPNGEMEIQESDRDTASAANSQAPINKTALGGNRTKGARALMSFSLYTNVPSILSTKLPKSAYTCMYGVRFWSMAWIVLGHTWQLGMTVVPDQRNRIPDNPLQVENTYRNDWTKEVITNMSTAVEAFFLLSACLVTIGFMRQLDKQERKVTCRQMGLYYFHRYWRLTPIIAVLIVFVAGFYNFLVDGPMVAGTSPEGTTCRLYWWGTIFYVHNLIPPYGACMGWTWYLAVDFQLYIGAPLFIIALYKKPVVGICLTIGGIIFSECIACVVLYHVYIGKLDWYTMYYIQPYCRFPSYGLGILLGYVMHRTKCKTKIPTWAIILGWTLAIIFCLTSIYGSVGRGNCSWCSQWTVALYILWTGFQRLLYAVGIAWLIFACCCGSGGVVNAFLSWKGFVPLGKLTYTVYLIHPLVVYYGAYSRSTSFHMLTSTLTILFAGYALISYVLAVFISAAFEVSMMNLEKVFLPKN